MMIKMVMVEGGEYVAVELWGPVFCTVFEYSRPSRWFRPNGRIKSRRLMRVDAKMEAAEYAPWLSDTDGEECNSAEYALGVQEFLEDVDNRVLG